MYEQSRLKDLKHIEGKSFTFDDVFDEDETTIDIYSKVLTLNGLNVINGYNSTIFTYGMTGAGKTYTMFGDIYNINEGIEAHPGLVSLIVEDLLRNIQQENDDNTRFQIRFSYLEIYNEQIRDLLSLQQHNENLMVIEDPTKGVIIPSLSVFDINESKDIIDLVLLGNSKRIMAATNSNQFSSRSHAILQITVEKHSRTIDGIETCSRGKLYLVDLAGSERAAASDHKGIRQLEGSNINRSLLALGNCINLLSDSNSKGAFIPYRDSKLTRLLKDSLGGNTKTTMIACISPFYSAYDETINTLKYASSTRRIKRKVVKNIKEVELHVSQYKDIIDGLKSEIEVLRTQIKEGIRRLINRCSYYNL